MDGSIITGGNGMELYRWNWYRIKSVFPPIGTKPHALGAVLYQIVNNTMSELVYDHPIRKATRTKGSSRILVYHISSFISSTPSS